VGDISAVPLPALDVADEYAASRLTIPLEADGERVSVYVDMTFLRDGRVVAGVFTFEVGSPFSDDERTRLTNLVAERMGGRAKNTPDTTAAEPAGGATRFRRSLRRQPRTSPHLDGGAEQ
jgi:hypothetical protein